jgi:hypothetical protein
MERKNRNRRPKQTQKKAAIILIIIAVVFWLWFGIGSAIVEEGTLFDWFMYLMMPAGIFIITGLIAWRWNRVGGVPLVLEGLLAQAFIIVALIKGNYDVSMFIMMTLTLGLPPLVSGILFIISGWKDSALRREVISPPE